MGSAHCPVGLDIWVKFEENPSISIDLIMEMDGQTDRRDKANPLQPPLTFCDGGIIKSNVYFGVKNLMY